LLFIQENELINSLGFEFLNKILIYLFHFYSISIPIMYILVYLYFLNPKQRIFYEFKRYKLDKNLINSCTWLLSCLLIKVSGLEKEYFPSYPHEISCSMLLAFDSFRIWHYLCKNIQKKPNLLFSIKIKKFHYHAYDVLFSRLRKIDDLKFLFIKLWKRIYKR